MITISILGLDQYVTGRYSRENTANIANLLETSEEDVNFYAPNSVIFHAGAEQTSWHTEVRVRAPKRFEPFEKKLADYLLSSLGLFTIGVFITFEYYDEERAYCAHNDDYPLYLDADHIVDVEGDSDDGSDDDCDPADHPELDPDNPEEIYLGDAFAGHEEELSALATEAAGDSHGHRH